MKTAHKSNQNMNKQTNKQRVSKSNRDKWTEFFNMIKHEKLTKKA